MDSCIDVCSRVPLQSCAFANDFVPLHTTTSPPDETPFERAFKMPRQDKFELQSQYSVFSKISNPFFSGNFSLVGRDEDGMSQCQYYYANNVSSRHTVGFERDSVAGDLLSLLSPLMQTTTTTTTNIALHMPVQTTQPPATASQQPSCYELRPQRKRTQYFSQSGGEDGGDDNEEDHAPDTEKKRIRHARRKRGRPTIHEDGKTHYTRNKERIAQLEEQLTAAQQIMSTPQAMVYQELIKSNQHIMQLQHEVQRLQQTKPVVVTTTMDTCNKKDGLVTNPMLSTNQFQALVDMMKCQLVTLTTPVAPADAANGYIYFVFLICCQ